MGLLPGTGWAQDEAEVEAEVEAPSRSTLLMVHSSDRGLNLLTLQSLGSGVSVEHAVGSHVALAASATGGLRSFDPRVLGAAIELEPSLNWNVRVEPGVHFYLSGRAPEGFWVGPHVEAGLSHYKSHSAVLAPNGYHNGFQLNVPISHTRSAETSRRYPHA
ncbi:hypothetical protein ACN28S_58470 [Cystobacter fuscus]